MNNAIPSAKWATDATTSIKSALRRYQKPLNDLVQRDANEGDTRLLVTDMLCDAFGYDKYENLTTEFAVRGEFADYGIRIEKQLVAFIEVKRAAQKLNARHLRQVETYAIKEGLEWVILTNGQVWQAYHVMASVGQQVVTSLALEVDLLSDESPTKKTERLFHLHHDALKRRTIDEVWKRQSATAPDALAKLLLADTIIDAIRKEVWRQSGFKAENSDLTNTLKSSVIRPELLL